MSFGARERDAVTILQTSSAAMAAVSCANRRDWRSRCRCDLDRGHEPFERHSSVGTEFFSLPPPALADMCLPTRSQIQTWSSRVPSVCLDVVSSTKTQCPSD